MGSRESPNMELKIADLDQLLRSRVRIAYRYRVDIESEKINEAIEWCEHNCKGLWNSHSGFAHYVQFENEQDAMLFSLRWK